MKTILRRATLLVAILGGFGGIAFAQEPITVPLALVDIKSDASSPDYKLGIWVGIGGGAPQLYEFDTGGKGFWASYEQTADLNPGVNQWWGTFDDLHHDIHDTYSSGNTYHAKMVNSSVQIYGNVYSPTTGNSVGSLSVQSTGGVDFAQIESADKAGDPSFGANWNAAVKAGQPALQTQFFGDFGASLQVKAEGDKEIFSVLPQLIPAGLTNGFIVSAGARGNTSPQVQLGLAANDLASFPIQFDISGANQGQYDDINTFAETLFDAIVSWSVGGDSQIALNVPVVLDTGAPVTSVHEHDGVIEVDDSFVDGKDFIAGVSFSAVSNGWQFLIDPTGDTANVDEIAVHKEAEGYINTGILAFNMYDVLFDLDHQILAFRPVSVPEPSSLFLLSGGLLLGGALLRRK
jgi:hypothetical protein